MNLKEELLNDFHTASMNDIYMIIAFWVLVGMALGAIIIYIVINAIKS